MTPAGTLESSEDWNGVGEAGHPLKQAGVGRCLGPVTGRRYAESNGQLVDVEAY